MKIFYIGKFGKLWDEECIARSLEALGHDVYRCEETVHIPKEVVIGAREYKPDIIMWAKLQVVGDKNWLVRELKAIAPTVCWLFDLYIGYADRQYIWHVAPYFKADFVFTTDGGHDDEWAKEGINHFTLRQGIFEPEAFIAKVEPKEEIVFVGSPNPHHPYRQQMLSEVVKRYGNRFKWYGINDTDEVRSIKLNELYASSKIVLGDSVYSPYYWSNRVYETIGRGGVLIHPDVPGLEKEFEYGKEILAYKRGDAGDLFSKIDFYLKNDIEREKIRKAGFERCKKDYTYKQRCQTLLEHVYSR